MANGEKNPQDELDKDLEENVEKDNKKTRKANPSNDSKKAEEKTNNKDINLDENLNSFNDEKNENLEEKDPYEKELNAVNKEFNEPDNFTDKVQDTSKIDNTVKEKVNYAKDKTTTFAKDKVRDAGVKGLTKVASSNKTPGLLKKAANAGVKLFSKGASKTVAVGSKLTASLGPIILIVLFVLWLLGIIFALIYIPSMMKDGFVEGVNNILKKINTRVAGSEGKVNDDDIYALGDYARSKGFQLYSDGFLYEKLKKEDTPNGSKYIPEEGIAVDEKKHITKLVPENSPLKRYVMMNAYTYTLENEQNQIIKGIRSLFGGFANLVGDLGSFLSGEERGIKNGDKFDGMIRFEHSMWNPENSYQTDPDKIAEIVFKEKGNLVSNSWLSDTKFKLDMEKKTLQIKYGWFSNPYIFNIEGWSGRYGMPTEFLLALHKSIMAPDLIYELTNGTAIKNDKYLKTKMLVRLIKAKGKIEGGFKVPNDTSIKGKLYDSAGNEVNSSEIDFDKVEKGEVIYYAKTGTEENPVLFPLKTTDGPVKLKLPTNFDETLVIPKTEGEDDKYDITNMYISFDDGGKLRKIPGYIINAETVKEYLSTTFNMNLTGNASKKADAFILNFGLHNLLRRYNEEFGVETSSAKFADEIEAAVNAITDTNFNSYLPLIYKVENHWFRDVYFYMNEGEKYTLIDEDEFIKKGEYWTKFKERNLSGNSNDENNNEGNNSSENRENKRDKEVDYKETDKAWSAYKIEPKPLENGKLNFKTYIVDEEDSDVNESIKNLQKLGDIIQIKEDFNLKVTQVEDGRRGETNKRTKELFKNNEWYIYDGTENTAKKINEARKNRDDSSEFKRRISKDGDLLAGSLMLENMESLDSEYAYRDYKELLLELDEYTVDDLASRIRRVLTWPIPGVSVGRTWPDTKEVKDISEFGVKVLTKEKTDKLIEDSLLDESRNQLDGKQKEKAKSDAKAKFGEGFEEGQDVVSPVTGKIVKQEDGKIEIEVLNEKTKDVNPGYKAFYEDEYKTGLAGYKITIQNINVGIEDKSKYKPQIKDKEIEKLSTEEQRKKVKEREDLKKDAPNRVGEYIKEGTVIGKTTNEDVVIFMTNIDDEIVEHVDKYLLVPYANLRVEILEDYLTRIIDGEPNQIPDGDVETFKKMFPKNLFPVINENAEAFMEMQETYGVNAIYAAAVALTESSGGTNFSAIPREYNNIFSMTGDESSEKVHHYGIGPSAPGSTNPRNWRKYKEVKDAILDFGRVTKNIYHDENLDYVSEIAPKYMNGSIYDVNENSINWQNGVNQFITDALKRYQDSDDDTEDTNQNDQNNEEPERNQNEEEVSASEEETFETNPFDLLGAQKGDGADYNPEPGTYEDSIFIGDVEYANGTYYFNQGDKKWLPATYGNFALSRTACGPFSSAIAFSAALGKPLDPREIANYSAANGHQMGNGGSLWSLFPALSRRYGVPVREISISEVDSALASGCVLIVSEGPGYWTTWGHFITVVNRTSDGKYLVNDPGSREKTAKKYSKPQIFNTSKNIWAVGPTEHIKRMQAGQLPPSGQDQNLDGVDSMTGADSGSREIPTGNARYAFEKITRDKGLSAQEKNAWSWLITNESNWKVNATNPSSGAYGLPQSLPGSKMASHGADWRTNPLTQLKWMYDYVIGRYGTFSNAKATWLQRKAQGNAWY